MGNEIFATTDKDILRECVSFYKYLYSSKNILQNDQTYNVSFETQANQKLDLSEQESCERLLTNA